ncbi:lysozyme inhibitor LprI family protein [Methylobacter svalbardensis]|uniref:lysozyme inhibitor LprI family protein n=1 Tax=Methylobacter svalbardensis TaxID=3080016 RepID=UPI0030EB5A1C
MSFFKYAAIAGLMAAIVQPAGAADEDLSQTFSTCMDQSGGVTTAMIECMGAETERQDVLLNQAYKEVMASLSSERKQQLQEVQRLWLKYRKANCDFYYDPDGGTLARVSANDCFMSATAARAKELEAFKQQD